MKAYEATGSYDSDGIRQIKQLIGHKDSAVAGEAIRTLRKIHSHGSAFDGEIIDAILKHLLSDPDQTSEIIAYVASNAQASRIGPFLMPLVKNGDGPYSLSAIDALTKLGFRSNSWRAFVLNHSKDTNDPRSLRVRSAMEIKATGRLHEVAGLEESRSAELQNTNAGESSGSFPGVDTDTDGLKVQPTSVTASSTLTEDTGYVDRPEFTIDGNRRRLGLMASDQMVSVNGFNMFFPNHRRLHRLGLSMDSRRIIASTEIYTMQMPVRKL